MKINDARYRDLYGNAGGIVTDKRSRDPKGKPGTRIETSGQDAREVKTTLVVFVVPVLLIHGYGYRHRDRTLK